MNKFSLCSLILTLILLAACQTEPEKAEVAENLHNVPCLFNLNRTFTPDESNLSFPLWFNDSMVRSKGIQTITRTLYATSDDADTNDLVKREVKQNTFDKEGRVVKFYVESYYDHTLVGSMTFNLEKQDEYGFALVSPQKRTYSRGDEEILLQYRIYGKEQYARKFLVYEDVRSGDYLFFMLREANWGPLSVDSILHPQRQDMIVLGTPPKPHKRYKVENRVNERDVILYDYQHHTLKGISFDKYPFHYERSLTFDKKGVCTGFIDSTFSNQRFLTLKQSNFTSKKGLISEIVHRNDTEMAGTGYFQIERLEYTFFGEK